MLNIPAEEVREDGIHHAERTNRHQHAPRHTEHGALVFLLEVSFNELFKEKPMLAQQPNHRYLIA